MKFSELEQYLAAHPFASFLALLVIAIGIMTLVIAMILLLKAQP